MVCVDVKHFGQQQKGTYVMIRLATAERLSISLAYKNGCIPVFSASRNVTKQERNGFTVVQSSNALG